MGCNDGFLDRVLASETLAFELRETQPTTTPTTTIPKQEPQSGGGPPNFKFGHQLVSKNFSYSLDTCHHVVPSRRVIRSSPVVAYLCLYNN